MCNLIRMDTPLLPDWLMGNIPIIEAFGRHPHHVRWPWTDRGWFRYLNGVWYLATCIVEWQLRSAKTSWSCVARIWISSTENMPVNYDGPETTVYLNGNNLLNILKTINDDTVVIRFNDPTKPFILIPEKQEQETEMSFLLMPMAWITKTVPGGFPANTNSLKSWIH